MSGLPEPALPAGWGYSYLDWIGAYSFALAILAALYHRERTGEGQWIDASQTEAGSSSTGPACSTGRRTAASGRGSATARRRSRGAAWRYRVRGEDRWIAIACFTDAEWQALAQMAGQGTWLEDRRFHTLEQRLLPPDAPGCRCGNLDAHAGPL